MFWSIWVPHSCVLPCIMHRNCRQYSQSKERFSQEVDTTMPPSGRTYVTFPYYYETFVVYLSYCAPSHLPQMSFIYVFCEGHFSLLYFHLTLIDVDTVLFHCIRPPYKGGSHKTCSCLSVRYFRTLFWDDITIFWDEN